MIKKTKTKIHTTLCGQAVKLLYFNKCDPINLKFKTNYRQYLRLYALKIDQDRIRIIDFLIFWFWKIVKEKKFTVKMSIFTSRIYNFFIHL